MRRIWKQRTMIEGPASADPGARTRFWKSGYSGRDKKDAKVAIRYSGRGRDNGTENKAKDLEDAVAADSED